MLNISEYLIIIDNQIMQEYGEVYKLKHPKSRKHPFANKKGNIKPLPPSLNEWMIFKRPQMNAVKQKWKEFIVWLVEKNELTNKQINKATITYKFYMPTKREWDLDNMTPKFINDGLTEAGFIVEDSISHIRPIVLDGGFCRENPRTEIWIKEME